jgi:transposase InsO family protein
VADITYLRLPQECVSLAVILDAYSRRCIGWALERTLEAELALAALRMALTARAVRPGLVHHYVLNWLSQNGGSLHVFISSKIMRLTRKLSGAAYRVRLSALLAASLDTCLRGRFSERS